MALVKATAQVIPLPVPPAAGAGAGTGAPCRLGVPDASAVWRGRRSAFGSGCRRTLAGGRCRSPEPSLSAGSRPGSATLRGRGPVRPGGCPTPGGNSISQNARASGPVCGYRYGHATHPQSRASCPPLRSEEPHSADRGGRAGDRALGSPCLTAQGGPLSRVRLRLLGSLLILLLKRKHGARSPERPAPRASSRRLHNPARPWSRPPVPPGRPRAPPPPAFAPAPRPRTERWRLPSPQTRPERLQF